MSDLTPTRLSLHGVAELLLAGPQYAAHGTIRLRRTHGGFGTVAGPDLRVAGAALVAGTRRVGLDGRTIAEVAAEIGVQPEAPAGLYDDHPDVRPETVLTVTAAAAEELADALRIGDEALRALAPETEPVLWPEHFDLAVTLDEVNYGVSPGDAYLDRPYAYVGPWSLDADASATTPFWNAPFGAAVPLISLGDARSVSDFFREGGRLARG